MTQAEWVILPEAAEEVSKALDERKESNGYI